MTNDQPKRRRGRPFLTKRCDTEYIAIGTIALLPDQAKTLLELATAAGSLSAAIRLLISNAQREMLEQTAPKAS